MLATLLLLAVSLGGVFAGCHVSTPGNNDELLLKGTVLTSDGAIHNGYVHVRSGKIVNVGSQCQLAQWQVERHNTTIIECRDSVISPGFINLHEHIAYSTVRPLNYTGELYDHRHDWRVGARNHTMLDAPVNGTEADATAWGELRHIFSGTTSIVGGYMSPGLTRNLDFVEGLEEGLSPPLDTWSVFPLDDSAGILRNGDCDYGPEAVDENTAGKAYRFMGHVAEGVDAEARNEFKCLSSKTFDVTPRADGSGISVDIMAPNVVLEHAVGLTEEDFDLVAKRGAKVVWAPRSNIFLYGKTLNVTYLLDAGIEVALGTDWLPSGSATMSREAACALYATKKSYDFVLEAKTIWEMMTINAAKVAGFEKQLGSLEPGKVADIVIFGGESSGDAYSQAIYSPEEDIELVMRGGKILLAAESLESLTTTSCETLDFGENTKIACVKDELNSTFSDFETSLQGVYPAILPGIPPDEPMCDPSR